MEPSIRLVTWLNYRSITWWQAVVYGELGTQKIGPDKFFKDKIDRGTEKTNKEEHNIASDVTRLA